MPPHDRASRTRDQMRTFQVRMDGLRRLDEAKSILHDLHINDLHVGSAESKLFPVQDEDGEIHWAVFAHDLVTSG